MKSIKGMEVTTIIADYRMFHLEIIYGQHNGRHWVAIPDWEVSAIVGDPAESKNIEKNTETLRELLCYADITKKSLSDELSLVIADLLHSVETSEVPV